MENKNDNVNSPKHYKETSLECIETMIIAFGAKNVMIYCCINAYKYMFRYKTKNGFEDLRKATWYLNKCDNLSKEYDIELPRNYSELRKTLIDHIHKNETKIL